jgi:hypothetical protein
LIIKCRQYISKPDIDKLDSDKNLEKIKNDVRLLCYDWERHYEQNKNIYNSEKFKKALLLVGEKI